MPERKNMDNKYQEALSDMIDNGVTCEWFNEKAFLPQEENPCFILQELVDRATPISPKIVTEKYDGIVYKTQICKKCGCKQDEDDRNFCPECGQALKSENN